MYFERQRKKLCGLHALNNFFQQQKYTQKSLNEIAYEIDISHRFINPHKSVLGLGDYDANVLVTALSQNGYEIQWFDKRNPITSINLDEIHGILINTISFKIFSLYEARHWFILKNMNKPIKIPTTTNDDNTTSSTSSTLSIPTQFNYVLFNSSNSAPLEISTREKVLNYLEYLIKNSNAEIILIK